MQIILKNLRLRNFKGIEAVEMNFNSPTNIYGENETGKSTINTAFTWLLTGKDEFDRADYKIKNTARKELNNLPHEVEAVISVDGNDVKLKRIYLEDWVKKRGEAESVLKGHKTEYKYNDVPCSATEYQVKIDAIIPGKVIKLITNPTYFPNLNWQDQRRGLISIAGNISDDEIFATVGDTLKLVLNSGKSAEEYKKELTAKKLLLKKKAVEYAPRIDEAKKNIPIPGDWKKLEAEVFGHEAAIKKIDAELENASLALAEKHKAVMQKQQHAYKLQADYNEIKNRIKNDLQAKQNAYLQQKKQAADNEKNKLFYQSQIALKERLINDLRDEWKIINSEKFIFDQSKCECPTCKQPLPAADITAQHDTLLKNFNQSVLTRKNEKVAKSNQLKSEIKQLQDWIASIESVMIEGRDIPDIETAVNAMLNLNGDALNIQDELSKMVIQQPETNDNSELKAKKQTHQLAIIDLRKKLSAKEIIENTQIRIIQLENEEILNAQAIADLEKEEFEVEKYTMAKMDILESKVNDQFEYLSFRLFEKLINGGVEETCVCEYEKVPYPTLNTASKLLAGIDIINTFSKFYNIYAPIFLDNRESVTWIPETKSQIINLFVSPEHKKLTIV